MVESDGCFKVSILRHPPPSLRMKPEDEVESIVMGDSPVS